MSLAPFSDQVAEYLALRRSQGYGMRQQEVLLVGFTRFADRIGHRGPLTIDLARRWALTARHGAAAAHPEKRLRFLRPFARHLAQTEPATQVPPFELLRPATARILRPWPVPDTALARQIDAYLALRRRLGYRLETHAVLLRSFARFAHDEGRDGPVTLDLAVRWAQATRSTDPAQPTRRLQVVRGLAKHLAAFQPDTEIPPAGLLGHPTRRRPPHVYSDAEMQALLRGARTLRPRNGLRPHTFVAFFSLLFCTGLRSGEARRLRLRDVHLDDALLTIRETKFGKSRLVPLHPSAVAALRRYAQRRDRCPHAPRSEFFFCTDHVPCLTAAAADATFSRLRRRLGWTAAGRARRPRIHDMRHTFAVRRLVRWYADGVDAGRKMLHLATYLGHTDVTDTYWYLSAAPELLARAAGRFEAAKLCGEERAP